MSRINTKTATAKQNFLASGIGLVQKSITVSSTGVKADEYGYKIVPAGTILPKNDATAVGILVEDVEVTDGDHEGAVIIAGRIYSDRLPVAPAETAITALTASGIHFDTLPETTR